MSDTPATPGPASAPRAPRSRAPTPEAGQTLNIPVRVEMEQASLRLGVHVVGAQPAASSPAAAAPVRNDGMPLWAKIVLGVLALIALLAFLVWMSANNNGNTNKGSAGASTSSGQSEAAALAAKVRELEAKIAEGKPAACTQAAVPDIRVENNNFCGSVAPAATPKAATVIDKSEKKVPAADKAVRPSTPAASGVAFIPEGGCSLTSNEDGAVLKSKPGVKLANGAEIAKASNQELVNDKSSLVVGLRAKHPTWLSEKAAHASFCYDWRKAMSADLVVSPGKLN